MKRENNILASLDQCVASNTTRILKNDQSESKLEISIGYLDDDSVIKLCEALKKNDYITELDFSRNEIGDSGVKAIAALSNIKKINLSSNHVTDVGAEILANCQQLESLNLGMNGLTNKGILSLIEHSNCSSIIATHNYNVDDTHLAKLRAKSAYNRHICNLKKLPGNTKLPDAQDYIEKHWKGFYEAIKKPKLDFRCTSSYIDIHDATPVKVFDME